MCNLTKCPWRSVGCNIQNTENREVPYRTDNSLEYCIYKPHVAKFNTSHFYCKFFFLDQKRGLGDGVTGSMAMSMAGPSGSSWRCIFFFFFYKHIYLSNFLQFCRLLHEAEIHFCSFKANFLKALFIFILGGLSKHILIFSAEKALYCKCSECCLPCTTPCS